MNAKTSSLPALILLLLCPVLLISPKSLPLAPYRKGNHWGYANPKTGKIVVQPDLDSVGLFPREEWYDNQVAWVKKDGRYGLINTSGKVILPIQEKEIASFRIEKVHNVFFAVVRYPPPENAIKQEARIKEDTENGYEEAVFEMLNGDTVAIQVQYEKEIAFNIGNDVIEIDNTPYPVAFFDGRGRLLSPAFYYEWRIVDPFMQWKIDPNGFGLPDFDKESDVFQIIWKAGKAGVFDLRKGKTVEPPTWETIFLHGRIAIASLNQVSNETIPETILIDLKTGKRTILPDSIIIDDFRGNSNLVQARNTKTNLYGFLDQAGRVVIPFQFSEANPFSRNGFTKVIKPDGTSTLIDMEGKEHREITNASLKAQRNHTKRTDTGFFINTALPEGDRLQNKFGKRAQKIIRENKYELHRIDGLGWLAFDRIQTKAFLFSPGFRKKRPWNIYHTQIGWNRYTGLFTVYDDWMDLVGYISQNGHVLFED